jgi:hypothetical protein
VTVSATRFTYITNDTIDARQATTAPPSNEVRNEVVRLSFRASKQVGKKANNGRIANIHPFIFTTKPVSKLSTAVTPAKKTNNASGFQHGIFAKSVESKYHTLSHNLPTQSTTDESPGSLLEKTSAHIARERYHT